VRKAEKRYLAIGSIEEINGLGMSVAAIAHRQIPVVFSKGR
jgi:hypothetical protein